MEETGTLGVRDLASQLGSNNQSNEGAYSTSTQQAWRGSGNPMRGGRRGGRYPSRGRHPITYFTQGHATGNRAYGNTTRTNRTTNRGRNYRAQSNTNNTQRGGYTLNAARDSCYTYGQTGIQLGIARVIQLVLGVGDQDILLEIVQHKATELTQLSLPMLLHMTSMNMTTHKDSGRSI